MGGLIKDNIISSYKTPKGSLTSDNMFYASIKYLGKTTNSDNTLLIATFSDYGYDNFSGVIGDIYATRGTSSVALWASVERIICSHSYNKDSGVYKRESSSLKIGKCIYDNSNYIAMQLGSFQASDIWFSGIYGDVCFKIVPTSDVNWI